MLKDRETIEWFWREREPLLDPRKFLAEEDEFYIITARDPTYKDITEKWLKRWLGNLNYKFFNVGNWHWDTYGQMEILNGMAEEKAKVINDERIEVYFDDSEYIVKKLRQLCPNCKVIHYGGRV